ncbi:MAG TPA: ADP-ribosylation factor-like protein, partial [Aggregicoccus sp.]|nr:ADP-ribosylation factor-like protein [Aggregicoccus sp.]
MSSVNLMAREVAAKIVFYGPGLSGKTTSLRKIYETVRPAHRGEMMSIATEGDRTLFFDFLPIKVEKVGDCSVRLALYTVPGQVFYNATRKLVLQGADGVVFVADSQPEAMDANRESLANLEENLLEQGIRLERFPLVIQYNKRDLDKVLPVEALRAELNPRAVPDFATEAVSGVGVLDALKAITRLVIKDLRAKRIVPAPREARAPVAPGFGSAEGTAGLEAQLTQHLNRAPPSSPQAPAAPPRPPAARAAQAVAPPALTGQRPLGPSSALAPGDLFDHARAAEAAFASGDNAGCVRACLAAVRRGLAFAGEGPPARQAFLLRVDGSDLLR